MRVQHLATAITFTTTLVVGVMVVTAGDYDRDSLHLGSPAMPDSATADYLPSAGALRMELRMEAEGMRCTERARLTDSIIVDTPTGAETWTFDQVMDKPADSPVWVRAYCTA